MGVAVSLVVVAGIVFLYGHALRVNQTTVALSLLLAILAVSAVWGILVSAFMSVVAMLAFNYFFLPPVGTFTIADPQNWVALSAFLIVAVIASNLSAAAQDRARAELARRREMARLFEQVAKNSLGEVVMATPAISSGVLYFRTAKNIIAVGTK